MWNYIALSFSLIFSIYLFDFGFLSLAFHSLALLLEVTILSPVFKGGGSGGGGLGAPIFDLRRQTLNAHNWLLHSLLRQLQPSQPYFRSAATACVAIS